MTIHHRVKQGEHLAGITVRYGFADYRTIWDHPQNAELKKKRQNPNVLYPGDQLFIPDKELKEYSRQTEKRHIFRVKRQSLNLRIRLGREYDQSLSNTECDLIVDGEKIKLTSDDDGQIEHQISKTAVNALLVIKDKLIVKDKMVPFVISAPIKIGYLDPVEEVSGQLARLINLGYYRGPSEKVGNAELLSAIEEFQCENNLTVDGKCGPKTQAKLKEIHGC